MDRFIFSCILFSLLFSSCGNKTNENLQHIRESVEAVESIVNTYDKNVQSAIDTKNLDYIKIVSKEALASVNTYLLELQSLQQSSPDDELLASAVSYVASLKEIIIAEERYSIMTVPISQEDGEMLDRRLMEAVKKAEQKNLQYTAQIQSLSTNTN